MAPPSSCWRIAAALLLIGATPFAYASDGALQPGSTLAGPFGYAWAGVGSHQSLVDLTFQLTDTASPLSLSMTTFDIDYPDEVEVHVNDTPIGHLQTTANNQTGSSSLTLAAEHLVTGTNTLQFRQRVHGWTWGIANVLLETDGNSNGTGHPGNTADIALQVDAMEPATYGWNWPGAYLHRDTVTAAFAASAENLSLSVRGYDVDFTDEVQVLLNDTPLGYLNTGPNDSMADTTTFTIPATAQSNGTNTLTFRQARASGYKWGVTDILLASTGDTGEPGTPGDMALTVGVIETGTFGWGWPGADAHRDVVTATFEATASDLELSLRGFDVDFTDEVAVSLNGIALGYLTTGPNDSRTDITRFAIAADDQQAGSNTLTFRQARASGYKWGVTDVLLAPAEGSSGNAADIALSIGVTDSGAYGWHWPGAAAHRDRVTASFDGAAVDLQLTLTGYDIDFADEVRVSLNGTVLAYLGTGQNNGLNSGDSLILPAGAQINGENRLVIEQARVSGYKWGITDLRLEYPHTPPGSSLPDLSRYELVFADEFDSSTLDAGKWNTGLLWGPYLPINGEEQLYVDTLGINAGYSGHDPFQLTGDTLIIEAVPTSTQRTPPQRPDANDPIWNDFPEYRFNGGSGGDPGYQASDVNYLSGIITSYDSFRMTHGYVEIRARLPAGRGLWPAFWLLNSHYVADSPEIDVMEFLGHDSNTVYQTYHYFDTANGWAQISTPSMTVVHGNWTDDFHTFGLAWGPRSITWYVDGEQTHQITDDDYRISGQAMYLLANLAVGGSWPGSPDAGTVFPARYEIDYIRAYQRKPAEPLDIAADFQLMFADEFDGNSLDAGKWDTHYPWGPFLPIADELHYPVDTLGIDSEAGYTPFLQQNGILAIEAADASGDNDVPRQFLPLPSDPVWADNPTFSINEHYTAPQYTAGMLSARERFSFSHGYAEMRVRFPSAPGLKTAFSLLNTYYIGQQPTIDIARFRGGAPHAIEQGYARYGVNGVPVSDAFTAALPGTGNGQAVSDDWHVVGVLWRGSDIHWYVDGERVQSYTASDVPYQLMYPVISVAVDEAIDLSSVSAADRTALIDYIRVYQIVP